MKTFCIKNLFLILFSALIISCEDDNGNIDGQCNAPAQETSDVKWWLLVRPDNNDVGKPGIYLFNETKSTVEYILNIPAKITSPHALDHDGKSLWIGGMGNNSSILELNPEDGSVRSEIKNIRTGGIACDKNNELWFSTYSGIYKITYNGVKLDSFQVSSNVIQDIAINSKKLFYLINGEYDHITEVDKINKQEHSNFNINQTATYAFAIRGENLVVIDDFNDINQFNIETKELVSVDFTNIKGWITAIAPYKENYD